MSTTKDIKESLQELVASSEKRSETARLRDIFENAPKNTAATPQRDTPKTGGGCTTNTTKTAHEKGAPNCKKTRS